jgi:hypothetical protein
MVVARSATEEPFYVLRHVPTTEFSTRARYAGGIA